MQKNERTESRIAGLIAAIDEVHTRRQAALDAENRAAKIFVTVLLESLDAKTEARPNADLLMTVKEVADLMRVDPRAVYNWSKKGGLPSLRVGDDLRFDRAEVNEYMRRHRKPIEPAPPRVVKFAASPDAAATRNKEQNGRTHI